MFIKKSKILPQNHKSDRILSTLFTLNDPIYRLTPGYGVYCQVVIPRVYANESNQSESPRRIKWSKCSEKNKLKFENILNNNTELNDALYVHLESCESIDALYNLLVKAILAASDIAFPKVKFCSYKKLYWNEELSIAHRNMNALRSQWLHNGRVQNSQSYFSYKDAKNKFRAKHRHAVNLYMQKLNDDIDTAAECDQDTFWKLVNSRRNKSCSRPGFEMQFDDEIYRDPLVICDKWKIYFTNLYTPTYKVEYDNDFKTFVESKNMEHRVLLDSFQNTDNAAEVTVENIIKYLKQVKHNKASGKDSIFYEHLIYGGFLVKQLVSILFTAMLKFSYTPENMKEGIIITLHKGGKKNKTDPNNYRAITLSSVFLKLFEKVIVDQLNIDNKIKINKLQGGFQEKMGCLMTSFAFRECLHFSNENNSKLYVCFLDSRQAFDRVWHDGLFYKLWQLGVNTNIYKSILSMYDGIKSKVRFRDHVSDWVHIYITRHQARWCKQSCLVFSLYKFTNRRIRII